MTAGICLWRLRNTEQGRKLSCPEVKSQGMIYCQMLPTDDENLLDTDSTGVTGDTEKGLVELRATC